MEEEVCKEGGGRESLMCDPISRSCYLLFFRRSPVSGRLSRAMKPKVNNYTADCKEGQVNNRLQDLYGVFASTELL